MNFLSFSSLFAKIIIFLFPFLLACLANAHEEFLKCLTTRISNFTAIPERIIYTKNDPSYSIVLNSSSQNSRFITPSTPKPFVIVMPIHVSEIQATVYCSKKHGIQIRTRSGGHDYEGLSYVSYYNVPFVVIDLRSLSSISIDVKNSVAWVQAGATLGELYYRISERSNGSLGFPAGICHTVGVGGQFSGGGYGFSTRKYGLSADNILDAQLINVEGRILARKSMGEDLFWAIRGGGAASFGIVIAWKIRLVPVPPKVTVFDVKRNMEDIATKKLVYRWQRDANQVDEDLTMYLRFRTANSIDEEGNKKIVLEASFPAKFHGSMDRLLELMQKEFPELGLQREECIEMSWVESFLYMEGFRNESVEFLLNRTSTYNMLYIKGKSDYVKEPIPNDAWEGILGKLYEEEIGGAMIELYPYGGKMDKISESAIPFPHRAGNLYNIQYYVLWTEQNITTSKKHLSWVKKLYNYMTPYVSKNPRATYFNFRDLDIGMNTNEGDTGSAYNNIERARIWGSMYFKKNLKRLIYVKTNTDPTNFFRNEQSIPPLPTH